MVYYQVLPPSLRHLVVLFDFLRGRKLSKIEKGLLTGERVEDEDKYYPGKRGDKNTEL